MGAEITEVMFFLSSDAAVEAFKTSGQIAIGAELGGEWVRVLFMYYVCMFVSMWCLSWVNMYGAIMIIFINYGGVILQQPPH